MDLKIKNELIEGVNRLDFAEDEQAQVNGFATFKICDNSESVIIDPFSLPTVSWDYIALRANGYFYNVHYTHGPKKYSFNADNQIVLFNLCRNVDGLFHYVNLVPTFQAADQYDQFMNQLHAFGYQYYNMDPNVDHELADDKSRATATTFLDVADNSELISPHSVNVDQDGIIFSVHMFTRYTHGPRLYCTNSDNNIVLLNLYRPPQTSQNETAQTHVRNVLPAFQSAAQFDSFLSQLHQFGYQEFGLDPKDQKKIENIGDQQHGNLARNNITIPKEPSRLSISIKINRSASITVNSSNISIREGKATTHYSHGLKSYKIRLIKSTAQVKLTNLFYAQPGYPADVLTVLELIFSDPDKMASLLTELSNAGYKDHNLSQEKVDHFSIPFWL